MAITKEGLETQLKGIIESKQRAESLFLQLVGQETVIKKLVEEFDKPAEVKVEEPKK